MVELIEKIVTPKVDIFYFSTFRVCKFWPLNFKKSIS